MGYLISKTFSKSELGYGVENFPEANGDISFLKPFEK